MGQSSRKIRQSAEKIRIADAFVMVVRVHQGQGLALHTVRGLAGCIYHLGAKQDRVFRKAMALKSLMHSSLSHCGRSSINAD